ncbi:MAG TPA: type II toxin-antitoxin system death-on-curing family toxin [bacterium]|jgi:death-on-curing protein|nr:type II toxin-antitoxin system death-on-curing family toxin [bacterium]
MKPRFLTLDEVLHLHQGLLDLYGGASGTRDLGALQSSLAMPEAGMGDEYFHKDLYEMAAAYLFHLCQNHPFVDGNKRIALASCRYFLHLNGKGFAGDGESLLKLTLDTASGKLGKAEIADYLRKAGKKKN